MDIFAPFKYYIENSRSSLAKPKLYRIAIERKTQFFGKKVFL